MNSYAITGVDNWTLTIKNVVSLQGLKYARNSFFFYEMATLSLLPKSQPREYK